MAEIADIELKALNAEHEDFIVLSERVNVLRRMMAVGHLDKLLLYAVVDWPIGEDMKKTNKVEDDDHKDRTQAFVKEDSKLKYDTEKIVALHKSGLKKSEIAKQIGCSLKTVESHLMKDGILDTRNRQEKLIDEDKIVALRTAREPRSVGWIARDLHCSEEKVIDVLKKRGIWEGNET